MRDFDKIWFSSDLHLNHRNIIYFEKKRSHFQTIEEHNDYIINQHNSIVGVSDRVIFVGDILFKKEFELLGKLNGGKKTLVMGNHDNKDVTLYRPYFQEILGVKTYTVNFNEITFKFVITHVPVHPQQLESRFTHNIHGHLHDEILPDKRYISVCLERLDDFKPINLQTILERLI